MELLNVIQEISQNTMSNGESVKIHFGIVTKVNPLRIKIDNKFEVSETFLILTNDVKDYETKISIPGPIVDTAKDELALENKIMTVNNALKMNERVILIKFPNGKKYIVLTRV